MGEDGLGRNEPYTVEHLEKEERGGSQFRVSRSIRREEGKREDFETHSGPSRFRIMVGVEPESEKVGRKTWCERTKEHERAREGVEEHHVGDGSESGEGHA